jgi:hypothetical protein
MARKRASQDDVDADFDSVSALADRMGLKDEEKDRYVHKHMTGLGHKSVRSYAPNDSDDSDDDDDFLPRRSRNNNGRNKSRHNRDDDDW